MKFLFRWAFRLLILALVLVIGLVLLADILIREAAIRRIRSETGLEVKIEKVRFAFFSPTISVENLVLYNPAEFGGSPLFDIPDVYVEYDYSSFRGGKVRLKLLRLGIREMNVVENEKGIMNMAGVLGELRSMPSTSPASPSSGADLKFDRIDLLNLSVGTVRYTNMRFPKRNQAVDVKIRNELIHNLRSPEDATGVLLKVLLKAGIPVYLDSPSSRPGPL